jgi:predicted amidophosphoribosyltransferase
MYITYNKNYSTIVTHVSQFVNWLLPQSCFLCGGISDRTLCPACLADLPYQQTACSRCACVSNQNAEKLCQNCLRHPVVFDKAKTVFAYEYPVDKLIQAAKYNQNLAVLKILGQFNGPTHCDRKISRCTHSSTFTS